MIDRLQQVGTFASRWRADVERAADSRRQLALAALDAMDHGHTVQDVADTIGWTQRASVYRLLKEAGHE